MRILDLDMDYFMDSVATFVPASSEERLDEENYSKAVWSSAHVRTFLECHLGLSKDAKERLKYSFLNFIEIMPIIRWQNISIR